MSKIRELKQPESKSGYGILDCLRRMLKLARQRRIVMCAIVFVGADRKVHMESVGPLTIDDNDRLCTAIDQLHTAVYEKGGDR